MKWSTSCQPQKTRGPHSPTLLLLRQVTPHSAGHTPTLREMLASPSAALFIAALRLAFFVQLRNLVGNLLP